MKKRIKVLLLHAASKKNATLPYQHAWTRKFQAHASFDCTPLNLAQNPYAVRLKEQLLRCRSFDAVVILHSAFSNNSYFYPQLTERLAALECPKSMFLGNEYKLLPEKTALCEQVGVELLVSMHHDPRAHKLYKDRLGCAVMNIPPAGLDTAVFYAQVPVGDRAIDIGYRSHDAPWYLGHTLRRSISEFFEQNASRFDLIVDISLNPADRFGEHEWVSFLNQCKGQVGTEAGGGFFEIDDRTRIAVNAFKRENPESSFEVVYERFFATYEKPIPGWVITSRHLEAAGTKTAQVLLEGNYSGYFQPDVHYIPLRKDFGNADEAVRKFKDVSFRHRVVENAHELARAELTYEKLIDRFCLELRSFL